MADENVFKLSRPLRTHKGDVTEITLKEPTAGTFIRAKRDPYKIRIIDGKPDCDFDPVASMAFLCEMTGLDEIVLGALPAIDFVGLRWMMFHSIANTLGADTNPSQP
jgi:hypothetical protein